jgi:hypothetical protein
MIVTHACVGPSSPFQFFYPVDDSYETWYENWVIKCPTPYIQKKNMSDVGNCV